MDIKECKPNQSSGLLANHTLLKGGTCYTHRCDLTAGDEARIKQTSNGSVGFFSHELYPDTFQAVARVVPGKVITLTKSHWVVPCSTPIQGFSHSPLSDIPFLLTSVVH